MENRKSIVLETISGVKTKNIDVKFVKNLLFRQTNG